MFFQNPFSKDFRANLVLGDRQYSQEYLIPAHKGRGDDVVTSNPGGPYNLTGNDTDGNPSNTLVIWYSYLKSNPNVWLQMKVRIDTQAANTQAATYQDIVNALNADSVFPGLFTAIPSQYPGPVSYWANASGTGVGSGTVTLGPGAVVIRAKLPSVDFKFYIHNGQAEELLLFNNMAGVGELPTYFVRHQVTWQFTGTLSNPYNNRNFSYTNITYATATTFNSPLSIIGIADVGFGSPYYSTATPVGGGGVIPTFTPGSSQTAFPDCMNALVTLNPYSPYNTTTVPASGGSQVDLGIIKRAVNVPTGAVLNATTPNPDWQLLRGKSGLFTFKKCQLDSNYNIVQMIEYPAGAKTGDLGKLTKYLRTPHDTAGGNPSNCFYQMTEEPYILQTQDLIQPTVNSAITYGS